MKRIAFANLGCKANFADAEELIAACRRAGFAVVPFDAEADAYVINTCTVTAVADQQSRQMLRRPKRRNPAAVVLATGCMGEVNRESADACGVDAIFGTRDRDRAIAFLSKKLCGAVDGPLRALRPDSVVPLDVLRASRESPASSPGSSPGPLLDGPGDVGLGKPVRNAGGTTVGRCRPQGPIDGESPQSRARAFLKIQDGCDRSCAYCIIPRARGKARSLAPEEVLQRCLSLGRHHREIVLTGIDLGQYGGDLTPRIGICDLLERLVGVDAMPRLRISSIDPTKVDRRLASLRARSEKFCRHVHLSIQSGSDGLLRRMGRGYGASEIARAVELLAGLVEDVAVTGDLIAGLPGETEADHRAILNLLASLPIAGLHVFPYSAREGTRAAAMEDQVPLPLRRERSRELREAAATLRNRFLRRMQGKAFEAIVTSRAADGAGYVSAFTDNAVSVSLPAGEVPYGEAASAVITDIEGLQARGLWDCHRKTRSCSSAARSGWATSSSGASI